MKYTEEFYSYVKLGIEDVDFDDEPTSPEDLFDMSFEYALYRMNDIYGYYSGWIDEVDIEGSREEEKALRQLAAKIFETM